MLQGIPSIMVARKGAGTVALFGIATNNANGPTVPITFNGIPAGALLVFCGASEDGSANFPVGGGSINDLGTGLTWTQRVFTGTASSGETEIWTATFTAGGNITVEWTGAASGDKLSGVLYAFTGADLTVGGVTASANAQAQNVSVSITPNTSGSYLVSVTSDFSGNVPGTTTYLDSAFQQYMDDESGTGSYTAWYYTKYNDPAGVPVNQGFSTANLPPASRGTSVIEIRKA